MDAPMETPDLSNRFSRNRKLIPFQLRTRPRNLHRSAITMFFLDIYISMRRDIASSFIVFNCDYWVVRAKCFKDDLSAFTAPDLDNVLMHEFISIFAWADRDFLPGNLNLVTVACGFRPTRTWIIG